MIHGVVRAALACLAAGVLSANSQDNSEAEIDLEDLLSWHGGSAVSAPEPIPAKITEQSQTAGAARGIVGPAAHQPVGALSGRIVFMNSGHGWTFETNTTTPYWRLQRSVALNSMNEDYGNLDQLNFFANYCFFSKEER